MPYMVKQDQVRTRTRTAANEEVLEVDAEDALHGQAGSGQNQGSGQGQRCTKMP